MFTPLLSNAGKLFHSVFARHSGRPVGLCTLARLATLQSLLTLIEIQSRGRLFNQTDEESFERSQQFTALYAGTLVQIFMERIAEARKMRLEGVSWEEFDAVTEIHSGIVYALDTNEEGKNNDTDGAGFPVTADMYGAYLKEYLERTIAAYEKAIEHATRVNSHQTVDDSIVAAEQFVENIRSISGYAETLSGPAYDRFLIGVNAFAARSRIRIQRICSQVIKRHTVTRTWD